MHICGRELPHWDREEQGAMMRAGGGRLGLRRWVLGCVGGVGAIIKEKLARKLGAGGGNSQ